MDELRARRALGRLDELAREHPALLGGTDDDNERASWEATLRDQESEDMARKARAGETRQVAVRLPLDLIDRLERHAERLGAQYPGALGATVSDAIRALVTEGLDRAEAGRGRRR